VNSQPNISVIIPTYNYSRFIPATIENVLGQSWKNVEIIIVDDGSTDNTEKAIRPYLSANVKYVYQKNAGPSAARNTGIQESSAEFIQFLDADDLLDRSALAERLIFLQNHPEYSIAVCPSRLFKIINGQSPRPLYFQRWPLYQSHLDVHLFFLNIAPIHAYLFRRQVIIETGCFDTRMKVCEDYDFWVRALALGYEPTFCPHGLVYYRRHKTSLSSDLEQLHNYDGLMNQRILTLLQKNKYLSSHPHRLDMIMAFLAGTFHTLSLIHQHHQQVDSQLMIVIQKGVQLLEEHYRLLGKPVWSVLSHFYYLKILYLGDSLRKEESVQLFELRTKLTGIAECIGAPRTSMALCKASLWWALFSQEANFLERFRLLKTTAQLLR